MHLFSIPLDWVSIGQLAEQEKNLEILRLLQQPRLVEHRLNKPARSSRVERLTVAAVTTKLKSATGRTTTKLRQVIQIFQLETALSDFTLGINFRKLRFQTQSSHEAML